MLRIGDRRNVFYWQTDRNLSPEDYEKYFLKRHETDSMEIVTILRNGIKSIADIKDIEIVEPDENVKRGNVNIVRKIRINGALYIARMHPKGIKNEYFYVEKLALIEAVKASLPVPEIVEVHEGTGEDDMDFVLMTSSPGVTMESAIQTNKDLEGVLLHDAGSLMAQLHTVRVEGFGSFNNEVAKKEGRLVGLHKSYKDFVWCGLEENLDRLVRFKVIDKAQSEMFKKVFKKNNYEPLEGSRLVHNDFADWNILVDGGKVSALLDWDECHAGDPIADLACWSTFFKMDRFKTFVEGYKANATLPKDFEQRFHYYRLRYIISKMALRTKRALVDKSEFIQEKIKAGKLALFEELQWIEANSS